MGRNPPSQQTISSPVQGYEAMTEAGLRQWTLLLGSHCVQLGSPPLAEDAVQVLSCAMAAVRSASGQSQESLGSVCLSSLLCIFCQSQGAAKVFCLQSRLGLHASACRAHPVHMWQCIDLEWDTSPVCCPKAAPSQQHDGNPATKRIKLASPSIVNNHANPCSARGSSPKAPGAHGCFESARLCTQATSHGGPEATLKEPLITRLLTGSRCSNSSCQPCDPGTPVQISSSCSMIAQ